MRGKRRDSTAKVEEDRREESLGDEDLACRPSHVNICHNEVKISRERLSCTPSSS
jgi:hypothetical protein